MQGDEDTPAHGFGVDFAQAFDDFGVGFAAEDFGERFHYVFFDGHAQAEIAECGETALVVFGFGRGMDGCAVAGFVVGKRRVQMGEQPVPTFFDSGNVGKGVFAAFAQKFGGRQVRTHFVDGEFARKILLQCGAQGEFVLDGKLDVDAFDTVRILAQPLQRNHHVFVDFKGVGVFGDGGGAAAVEPEGFARFGRHGDKAFAVAGAGKFADVFGGCLHGGFVV